MNPLAHRRTPVVLAVAIAVVIVAGVVAVAARPSNDVAALPVAVTTTIARTTTSVTATTAAPTTTTSTTTTTAAPTTTTSSPPSPAPDGILLVWTSGGLPAGFVDDVRSIPSIHASTVGVGGQADLVETFDAAGRIVDTWSDGWAVPLDVVGVDPAGFGRFRPALVPALADLSSGSALLTESSAMLRRIGVGGTIVLRTGAVTVVGVVPDIGGAGAELLIHTDDAARLGLATERFLYVADTDRAATERAIRGVTPPGDHLSLRPSAEVTWLRHGDRVEPKIVIKRRFGEFAYRDRAGRDIEMDPAWVATNIRSEQVPILGEIRCHRDVIPVVRAAMQALVDSGRADAVDASSYAGCWNPRRIGSTSPISHHAWGIALDINVGANPRGDFATQDPALVKELVSRGFSWGGRWEYPDPAHYEAAPSVSGTWPP